MQKIDIGEPITVTLRAADWFWVMGLLSTVANSGDSSVLDLLFNQIMDKTQ